MRPRRLSSRIALAFLAVELTTLLAVGAGLFVTLRSLHREATIAALGDLAQPLVSRVLQAPDLRDPAALVRDLRSDLRPGVEVHLRLPGGRTVSSDRSVDVAVIELDDDLRRGAADGGTTVGPDGEPYLWAATVLRAAGVATDAGALFVTAPDTSGAAALRDLGQRLPALVAIALLVAAPIAWLLARSVVRPLRRLSEATRDVPLQGGASLPLGGPREVRELTGRFNAMTAELERTRREEAALLAGIRHDLRTPLTVIGGFAQALEDGTANGEDVARAARAIADETARMARLVEGLGTLEQLGAGPGSLRPETIDAAEAVATAVERFARRATETGVALRSEAAPGLSLTADRDALDRILANLVENALGQTARPGGTILVDARPAGGPGDRAAIALRVSDDGPGFPAGSLDRVFDRFYRADPARSGSGAGLGLAIVRALARAHGGDVVAENLAPTGARVTVTLPVLPRLAPPDHD